MDRAKSNLQAIVDHAYQVLGGAGLSEEAFDRADISVFRNSIWLIARGIPVSAIVKLMNQQTDSGRRVLSEMRRAEEKRMKETTEKAHRKSKSPARVAEDIRVASLISKLDSQALMSELHAFLRTERNQERLKLVFLEILRLHQSVRQGPYPEIKRTALACLKPDELRSCYFDACNTALSIREIVGDDTVKQWIKE